MVNIEYTLNHFSKSDKEFECIFFFLVFLSHIEILWISKIKTNIDLIEFKHKINNNNLYKIFVSF